MGSIERAGGHTGFERVGPTESRNGGIDIVDRQQFHAGLVGLAVGGGIAGLEGEEARGGLQPCLGQVGIRIGVGFAHTQPYIDSVQIDAGFGERVRRVRCGQHQARVERVDGCGLLDGIGDNRDGIAGVVLMEPCTAITWSCLLARTRRELGTTWAKRR